MARRTDCEALRKALVAFELTATYIHEESTVGRGAAVQNLRIGLKREGLWLGAEDDQLLHEVRLGAVGYERLREMVCSFERTGYPGEAPPPQIG